MRQPLEPVPGVAQKRAGERVPEQPVAPVEVEQRADAPRLKRLADGRERVARHPRLPLLAAALQRELDLGGQRRAQPRNAVDRAPWVVGPDNEVVDLIATTVAFASAPASVELLVMVIAQRGPRPAREGAARHHALQRGSLTAEPRARISDERLQGQTAPAVPPPALVVTGAQAGRVVRARAARHRAPEDRPASAKHRRAARGLT